MTTTDEAAAIQSGVVKPGQTLTLSPLAMALTASVSEIRRLGV